MRRRGAATVSVAVAITSGRADLCPAHDVTASVYCYAGRDDTRKCAVIGYNAGGVSSQSAHVSLAHRRHARPFTVMRAFLFSLPDRLDWSLSNRATGC